MKVSNFLGRCWSVVVAVGLLGVVAVQAQTYQAINANITKVIPNNVDNLPSFSVIAPVDSSITATAPSLALSFSKSSNGTTNYYKTVVSIGANDDIYGGGEYLGDLRRNGDWQMMWNTDNFGYGYNRGQQLYQTHPWYIGVRPDGTAYGILFDTTYRARVWIDKNASSPEIAFETEGVSSDGYYPVYVIEDDSPQDIMRHLGTLTGTIEMPPLWALGYHQARWSYTDAEAKTVVDTMRQKNLPLDVMWYDIDFMDNYKVFTFGSGFPDPAATDQWMENKKVKTVWIVDPGVKIENGFFAYDQGQQNNFNGRNAWIKNRNNGDYLGEVWPGWCKFPDFTNDKVADWWAGLHNDFVSKGIDGIWNDMNEPAVWQEDLNGVKTVIVNEKVMTGESANHAGGVTLDNGSVLPASNHELYHNVYGMLMSRATRQGMLNASPTKRPFVLSRANFIGGQRYAATWTGDNKSTVDHMEKSIPMSINLSLSGQPFNGPDLPGFAGKIGTTSQDAQDLAGDWFAIGAFMPFCRGHMALDTYSSRKEPYQFGTTVENSVRHGLNRRYRLMPYIYSLFEEASRTGMPVMQPAFFAYPSDASLRAVADCYLLGPNLLVVPRWATKPSAFNQWAQVEIVSGADSDIYQCKLYLRPGAMIPLGPVMQSTQDRSFSDDLEWLANFDASGNATGILYEDDGDGFGYQSGKYRRVQFDAVKSTLDLTRSTLAGNWLAENRDVILIDADNTSNTRTFNEQTLSGVNIISTAVTATGGQTTVSGNFGVTVTFGENVTGFVAGDVQLSAGSVTSFSGSGKTYTFTVDVSGVQDGPITVTVPSNVAANGGGDPNGSSSLNMTLATEVATTLATASGQTTVSTNFSVNVTFGQSVTGFAAGDVNLSAGSLTGFSGSGASYSFTVNVAGLADGPITISIPAAAATASSDAGMKTVAASLVVTLNTTPATTQGLVVHYPFDETAGFTATDASGSGNDGTVSAGAQWTASGKIAGAIQFDSNKDNGAGVEMSNASTVFGAMDDEITVAFWVYDDGVQSEARQAVFFANQKQVQYSETFAIYLFYGDNNIRVLSNGVTHDKSVTETNYQNKWVHWAVVKNATTLKIYADGVEIYSGADTTVIDDAINLVTVGGIYESWQSKTWYPYPGKVDDFRIYNRALSVSEVSGLMGGGGGGPTTTPPVAQASANPASGPAPLAVQFSSAGSSDSDGNIASYAWDFGDGTTSTQANPSHTYAAGSYTASLTVTDNDGLTATKSVSISSTTTTTGSLPAGYIFRVDANDVDGDGSAEGLGEAGVATDGSISAWVDKGSKGTQAVPEVAANQPKLLVNALNGKSTVQFDGVDDFLKFAEITDARTVIWVVKDTEINQSSTIRPLLGHYSAMDFLRGAGDALWNATFASAYVKNGSTWLDGQVTAGLNAGENLTPNQWSTVSVVTTGPTKASQITRDRGIATHIWKGEIAEIVIYNTALSDVDRKAAEDFLKAKWFNAAPSSGYDSWDDSISSGDSSRTGDADGDGIMNLMEYALDLDPNAADSTGLPTAVMGASNVDYTFNAAQSDVTYQVEISNDLQSWRNIGTATTGAGSTRTVTIPLSEMTDGLFVRLKVSE